MSQPKVRRPISKHIHNAFTTRVLTQGMFALFATLISLLTSSPSRAQAPLSQMYHRAWTARDGVPSGIQDMVQGADGYLWFTTDDGLYRFDGVAFARYKSPTSTQLLSDRMNDIAVSRDRSLWIGYMLGGLTRIRGNEIRNFTPENGLRTGHIGEISADQDGKVWVVGTRGLQYVKGDQVIRYKDHSEVGERGGESLAIDRDGNIWSTNAHGPLEVLPRGSKEFLVVSEEHYTACIRANDSGVLCRSAKIPVKHFIFYDSKVSERPIVLPNSTLTEMLWAKDGSVWIPTQAGILRFPSDATAFSGKDQSVNETFGRKDGLTSDQVEQILEDREGDIWVLTAQGLDQFRPSYFRTIDPHTFETILPSNNPPAPFLILGAHELRELTAGTITPRSPKIQSSVPRSMYHSEDGSVWIGTNDSLYRWADGKLQTIPLPQSLSSFPAVQTLVEDSEHHIWASITGTGLYERRNEDWIKWSGLQGLPPTLTAYTSLHAANGDLWFAFRNNTLARLSSGKVTMYGEPNGLHVGDPRILAERGHQVWIGGDRGVFVLRDDRFQPLLVSGSQSLRGVSGLTFLQNGDVWGNSTAGVFQVKREEIAKWEQDLSYAVHARFFDYLDGLYGIPSSASWGGTAALAPDGNLYFLTQEQIQWVDPLHPPYNAVVPQVFITDIGTPERIIVPIGATLRFAKNTRNLQISYTATSLLIPERVRFRYRLQGFDKDWVDAGSRRQAFYAKIPAGSYTFQVVACNDSGVWSPNGASVSLTIEPTFIETIWFKFAGLLSLLGLVFLSFRFRLNRTKRRIANRMYEILGERQRIARDLHDTLLQSVQALMFKVGVAARKLPVNEPVRGILEETVIQSDQVLLEGRKLISSLQTKEEPSVVLVETLRAIGDDLQRSFPSTDFVVDAQGSERVLSTVVNPELCTIGREALTNAFQHANAAHVWLTLYTTPEELQLQVRDDGNGIDDATLARGYREEHWGLRNMRARAERLGGRLTVESSAATGTTVAVTVPAFVAYKDAPRGFRETIRRLFR